MRSIIVLADRSSAMENRLETSLDLARSCGGHLTILVDTPVTRFVSMDPLGGGYVASQAMEQALAADDRFAAEIDARLASQDVPFDVLRSEAETLAGSRLKTRDDSADFAESLVRQGAAEVVVIARGADGSVMATRDGRWFAKGAEVPVTSRVGAGDSFVAAFTLALARGRNLPRALQEGMAAASAAVMTEATELARASDFRRLIAACPVAPA